MTRYLIESKGGKTISLETDLSERAVIDQEREHAKRICRELPFEQRWKGRAEQIWPKWWDRVAMCWRGLD